MLKKFAYFFIVFLVSFLVQSFGWTDQGRAFLYIDVVFAGLIYLIYGLSEAYRKRFGRPILVVGLYAVTIGIELFVIWVVTRLLNVDFFVAYQIMRLGQCFCSIPNNKTWSYCRIRSKEDEK